MSDSEDSSSSDGEFTTTRLRALLKSMLVDIDNALEGVKRVLKEEAELEKPLRCSLTQPAQEYFDLREATKEEILKILVNQWSQEGRLSLGGSSVRIPDSAATLLHLPPNESIHWSLVWKALDRVFDSRVDGR